MARLRREFAMLHDLGFDEWVRRRGFEPASIAMVCCGVYVLVVIGLVHVPWPLNATQRHIEVHVATGLSFLVVSVSLVGFVGRSRSLRYDDQLSVTELRTADLFNVALPTHPVWWREGTDLWQGRARILILGLAAAAFAFALTPIVESFLPPSLWWPFYLTWVLSLSALLLLLLALRGRRQGHVQDRLTEALKHASGTDLRASRDRVEGELSTLQCRLDRLRESIRQGPLDANLLIGMHQIEESIEGMQAKAERSEHRAVIRDFVLMFLGVALGYVLTILGGTVT